MTLGFAFPPGQRAEAVLGKENADGKLRVDN
jgi:hypothetical protein